MEQREKPVTFFPGALGGGRVSRSSFCSATVLPHCPRLAAPPLSPCLSLSVPSISTCPPTRAGRGCLSYPVPSPAPRTVPEETLVGERNGTLVYTQERRHNSRYFSVTQSDQSREECSSPAGNRCKGPAHGSSCAMQKGRAAVGHEPLLGGQSEQRQGEPFSWTVN